MSNAHAATPSQSTIFVNQQQYKLNPNQIAGAVTPSVKNVTEVVHVNPRAFSLDANSDTVGDVATARFGCDCFSCRAMALQMLQTGQLSLPN